MYFTLWAWCAYLTTLHCTLCGQVDCATLTYIYAVSVELRIIYQLEATCLKGMFLKTRGLFPVRGTAHLVSWCRSSSRKRRNLSSLSSLPSDIDECVLLGMMCANGGTPVDGVGVCTCRCRLGYSGSFCNVSTPCSNDTTCGTTGYCHLACNPAMFSLPSPAASLLDDVQQAEGQIPTSFNGDTCVLVDPSSHPAVSDSLTIFASIRQAPNNDGYILLNGDHPESQSYGLRLIGGRQLVFPVRHIDKRWNTLWCSWSHQYSNSVPHCMAFSSCFTKDIFDVC